MILTCPQCSSRFMVADELIGTDGRKVKCSSCAHIWFQEPKEIEADVVEGVADELPADEDFPADENENVSAEIDPEEVDFAETDEDGNAQKSDDGSEAAQVFEDTLNKLEQELADEKAEQGANTEDIPDSVKPLPENEQPAIDPLSGEVKETTKSRIIGYALAAVFFVLCFIPVILMSGPIMKSWKPSIPFYKTIGISVPPMAEDLVFDRLKIEIVDDFNLKLSGHIINLSDLEQPLPYIRAVLRDKSGNAVGTWFIRLQQDVLAPESMLAFYSEYQGLNTQANTLDVKLTFTKPESLPARAGGEVSHNKSKDDEEHGGDTHHENDHEEEREHAPEHEMKADSQTQDHDEQGHDAPHDNGAHH